MNDAAPARIDAAKFGAARLWAVTRMPYLASALFACTPVPAPGSQTVAVDRSWRVHADPATIDELTAPDLGRLLVHLVSHLVRDHAARAGALQVDDRRAWWNRCADAEINDDLRADDCRPTLAGALPGDLGCPDGKLAESYFGAVPPDEQGDGAGSWDCGSGSDAHPRPWDADGSPGVSASQAHLLQLATAADVQARDQREPGTVAAGWLRWAEIVRPSRTDWRRALGAEIRRAAASVAGSVDYSYRRPSRRARREPGRRQVVLPTLIRPVPIVAIVCDTSGSMDEDLLARALAEIEGLLARTGLRSRGATVLAVDVDVQAVSRVSRADQVRLGGGGGTDMGAGIEAAGRLRPRPDVIVVLTDGYTPWPDEPPANVRVVVGLLAQGGHHHGDQPPPWARTIVIDED